MKKLIILFYFLAFVTLLSCDKSEPYPAKRRLANLTTYPLKIKVWSNINNVYEYNLTPFETTDISGTCNGPMFAFCTLGWKGTLDSASITFANEKIQMFGALPSDQRVKAINADPVGGNKFGYLISEEDGVVIYKYEITQEDYDNAEDIGG